MTAFEAVETTAENQVAGWAQTTDNVRLWVDIRGTGRPVMLLHGWSMSSLFWRRQHQLADRFQLITLDFRGHGKSQATPRDHTMERYAHDVRQVITALGLNNVMLAGWSMGGAVALEYWQLFGNRGLSGIGLIETAPAPASSAAWNNHACRGNELAAVEDRMSAMTSNRQAFAQDFINAMFLSGSAPSHCLRWMKSEQMRSDTTSLAAIYRDYVQRDYTPALPTISIPALVVYGRSLHMCYGPSIGRFMAANLPHSHFAILDKSGHMPFYEQPDEFNAVLTDFLAQLPT